MTQERTKPKINRVVASDDFAVIVNGELFFPHAGEEVVFKGRLNADNIGQALRMMKLDAAVASDPEALVAALTEVREFLASFIVSTTWTDAEDRPYESVEALLADADFEEQAWLLHHLLPERTPQEQLKDSAPST